MPITNLTIQDIEELDSELIGFSKESQMKGGKYPLRPLGTLLQQLIDGVNSAGPGGSDEKVKTDATDPLAGFLQNKLLAGTNITLSLVTDSGTKKIQIDAAGGGGGDDFQEIYDAYGSTTAIIKLKSTGRGFNFTDNSDAILLRFENDGAQMTVGVDKKLSFGTFGGREGSIKWDSGDTSLKISSALQGDVRIEASSGKTVILASATSNEKLGFFGGSGAIKASVPVLGAQTLDSGTDQIEITSWTNAFNAMQQKLDAVISQMQAHGMFGA